MLSAVTPSHKAREPPLETQKSGSGVIYGNTKANPIIVARRMRVLVILSSPIFLEDEKRARESTS